MNGVDGRRQHEVLLFSFGFKYGVPEEVNLLLDVRFLPNPYWEEGMRHLTGQHEAVAAYVLESEEGRQFLSHLGPLVQFMVEGYRRAKKMPVRIGIGCTGGYHRSVAVVEWLGRLLASEGLCLQVAHRDMDKE
ncbi:MAG: hypothetical protein ACK5PS_13265 [Desulfopila sp.]